MRVSYSEHGPAVLLSLRVKTRMFFVSFCHFVCVSEPFCFGFFFFFCSSSLLFVCCQLAPECARAHVRTWPRTYPCACICDGDGRFMTVALLIFATIKTPRGAQCSESQHWDSTHLDPMAHRTSHDKCVRIYEQVHEYECRQVRLFFVRSFLDHGTVNECVSRSFCLGVYVCVCMGVCRRGKREG